MASIKGGDKLRKYLADVARKISHPATLRVGFLEGATYPNGKSVPMVAAIQEFGAPSRGIPPRPFFRNMIKAKSSEWPKAIGDLLVRNDFNAEKTLLQVGEAVSGQLKQSIRDTNAPPLKPATVKRKGFDKPLIDTGTMINSVDYEVKTS